MATVSLPSDLLSREDAAAYLGVSPRTLAIWASTGRYDVPCEIVGGKIRRYRREALDNWLANQTRLAKEKMAKRRAARPTKRDRSNDA